MGFESKWRRARSPVAMSSVALSTVALSTVALSTVALATTIAVVGGCAADFEQGSTALQHLGVGQTFAVAGYDMISWAPAEYKTRAAAFGGAEGWDLELYYLEHDPPGNPFDGLEAGIHRLARADYSGAMNIPPPGQPEADYISRIGITLAHGAEAVVIGNEPNWYEVCRPPDGMSIEAACGPQRYAEVYAAVKRAYPDALVLMAGPTPDLNDGDQVLGHMWMRGETWLEQTTAAIRANLGTCPDGFGIHVYADVDTSGPDPLRQMKSYFRQRMNIQLRAIRAAQCQRQPILVTEFHSQPEYFQSATFPNAAEHDRAMMLHAAQGLAENPEWANVMSLLYFVLDGGGGEWGCEGGKARCYSALPRGLAPFPLGTGHDLKTYQGLEPAIPVVEHRPWND